MEKLRGMATSIQEGLRGKSNHMSPPKSASTSATIGDNASTKEGNHGHPLPPSGTRQGLPLRHTTTTGESAKASTTAPVTATPSVARTSNGSSETSSRNGTIRLATKHKSDSNAGEGNSLPLYENAEPTSASLVPRKPSSPVYKGVANPRSFQSAVVATVDKTNDSTPPQAATGADTGGDSDGSRQGNHNGAAAVTEAASPASSGRPEGEVAAAEEWKRTVVAVPLSPRATAIVARIHELMQRCHYYQCLAERTAAGEPTDADSLPPKTRDDWEPPSEEEQVMYEVLLFLYNTPIGPVFMTQPEISLSNRSCVLTTPGFNKDEVIAGYTICAPYNPGTVGRSHFAARKSGSSSSSLGEDVAAAVATATVSKSYASSSRSASFSLAEAKARKSAVVEKDLRNFSVMKVVSFRLRKEVVKGVISDQCLLTKINSENVLRVSDVLKDEYLEKIIIITTFHQRGNLSTVAGKLDADPDRFRRITADVALGLALLHSHRVFHHNLKPENVLETAEGRYCVADAGFYRLFTSQCPEALIFNGELACLPPEVFDEDGPYASVDDGTGVENSVTTSATMHHHRASVASPIVSPNRRGRQQSSTLDSGIGEDGTVGMSTVASESSGISSDSQSRFLPQQQQQQRMTSAAKADVWGFGVLLYRLAYGRDPLEIAMRHIDEVRDLVRHHEPVYPPKPTWPFLAELVDVMEACMQKDPAKRPDMNELLGMPYFRDMGIAGATVPPRTSSMATSIPSAAFGNGAGFARPASSSGHVRSSNRNGYTIEGVLGAGRVSKTMLVHQRRNVHKRFAFKMLKKPVLRRVQAAYDPVKASNAVKEARAHAVMRSLAISRKMWHPNIVPYVDIVDDKKGRCFVVQEYMKNGPLTGRPMLTSSRASAKDVERLLSDVLLALVYLHDNEMAHLSLTPSNIFLDDVSGHYRVSDFGPLFLTMGEIVSAELKGKPIYHLPSWIFKSDPTDKYHVDTFFVGLLAASTVPTTLSPTLWDQVVVHRCSSSGGNGGGGSSSGGGGGGGGGNDSHSTHGLQGSPPPPITGKTWNVDEVLRAVRNSRKPLPPKLLDFIETALTKRTTARKLIEHPYFNGKYSSHAIPVEKVEVSAEEIATAVRPRPPPREEQQPMMDVLGQDPFTESQMVSCVMGECDTSLSGTDKSLVIIFTGDTLRCGQCKAEVTIALYRCSICPDVVRCGKCAVNDSHHLGHTLVPFVVRSLERGPANTRRAQLCHPSSIQDVHALETLEMGANFPVGSLSGQTKSQRQMERSMVRTVVTNPTGTSQRLLFGGVDLGSTTYLPDPECSVSGIGVRSSTSLKPMNSASSSHQVPRDLLTPDAASTAVNGGSFGARGSSFRSGNTSGSVAVAGNGTQAHGPAPGGAGGGNLRNLLAQNQPPAPPTLGGGGGGKGNLLAKAPKKLVLPKAEDLDDLPWEEELRLCRESEHTELLLFNYGFTQVPSEVFTPPPLQVVFLDLSQNELTSLPHEISFLAHLRKLVVSYNKLVRLPDSLGNLLELESVDASHNMLTDLPMTFVYLTSLQSCAMDYNCFKEIPQSIIDILAPNEITASASAHDNHHEGKSSDGNENAALACSEGKKKKKGSHERTAAKSPGSQSSSSSSSSSSSLSGSSNASISGDDDDDEGNTPNLSVLYLAGNDSIVSLPDIEKLRRFTNLKIALDNEPSLYKYYMVNDWENKLPNVSITWNKIYPDEIITNLYCGSLRSAQSQMVYKKLKISYVLTVGRGLVPVPPEGGKHKTIIVDDIPGADILASMTEAIDFIEESQRAGSGCLVHCFAGLSRSATTVIAYLMVKKHMRLDEAYLVAKRGRPAILPNNGFFKQLLDLDKQLFPKATRPLDIASLDRPPEDLPAH